MKEKSQLEKNWQNKILLFRIIMKEKKNKNKSINQIIVI